MNKLIIFSLFCCYLIAQVAPFKLPENLFITEKNSIDLSNYFEFNFNNSDKFFLNDSNNYIWQKTFSLNSSERVVVEFDDETCGNNLFLINDKKEFSGPYDLKSFKKTNPFKATELTIQILSNDNCDVTNQNFKIQKFEDISQLVKNESYYEYRENPIILITGYWPPTNEMIRDFSQDLNLNPNGWIGDNWENKGYDVISYFPEFEPSNCDNCGQGFGDLQVDYQNTSQDFWPIVEMYKPIAIITFSRGFIDYSWELEYNYYNRLNWISDYYPPYLPTPNPPDEYVENYFIRHSSLPMQEIMDNINNENIGLDSYIDWYGDPGRFVSEFMGYHGVWYRDINQLGNDRCITAGHVHVGGLIDVETAKIATHSTIRTVIDYLDQFIYLSGDVNQDDIIDILDLVLIVNFILSIDDFTIIQQYAADINQDSIINIQDVIGLINIILEN